MCGIEPEHNFEINLVGPRASLSLQNHSFFKFVDEEKENDDDGRRRLPPVASLQVEQAAFDERKGFFGGSHKVIGIVLGTEH